MEKYLEKMTKEELLNYIEKLQTKYNNLENDLEKAKNYNIELQAKLESIGSIVGYM